MRIGIVVAAAVLAAGCGGSHAVRPGEIVTNETARLYAELPKEAVLVAIGEQALTKADLDGLLAEEKKIYMLHCKTSYAKAEKQWANMRGAAAWGAISSFLLRTAFSHEAAERGLKASTNDVQLAMRSFEYRAKGLNRSFEKYQREFPGGARRMREIATSEALAKAVFPVLFSNSLDVTDAEVDEIHAGLIKRNADSTVSNKIIRAATERVRAKFIAGDYVCSEERGRKSPPPEYEMEALVGTTRQGLPDEDLVPDAVKAVKRGEWTAVVELEDSFDFYCITNIVDRSGRMPEQYSGWRVTREKDHGYLVPEKAKIKADIRRGRNMAIVLPEGERLMKKIGVVYPYGFVWEPAHDNRILRERRKSDKPSDKSKKRENDESK